jgi:gamma-glutamyltranspeptidase/glutathione hydrolase
VIQRAAWATDPHALEAAEAALGEHGTAADAVVAGWFALAGEHPGVLLAPLVALVAGPGIGARAYDGRAAQPGAGVPRPRGTRDEPTTAARAAAPRGYEMVLLLAAEAGKMSLATQAARGVARARAIGAPRRATALDRVGALGAPAIRSGSIAESLVRVAGVNAGGLLTPEDLTPRATTSVNAATTEAKPGGARVLSAPWPSAGAAGPAPEVVLSADAKGAVAVLATYPRGREVGATLRAEEFELELPLFAEPVRRGVPRVAPGTRLPLGADVALIDGGSAFRAALARISGAGLELGALADAVSAHELPLHALAGLSFAAELRAVTVTPEHARVWSGG